MTLTVVIPARNEESSVGAVLERVRMAAEDAQIIVIDDGSADGTAAACAQYRATVETLPYNHGNGAAIKRGALHARGEILVFLDSDGQHDPADIPRLLAKLDEGYDMVVGARSGLGSQASIARWGANAFYSRFASWMVGHRIEDLTSGFRAVRRDKFLSFLHLLPNGFSYPTTITMAFFRAGYSVGYVPIKVARRTGRSHVNLLRDGLRFLLIIFKIGTLYSPLKVYFPASVLTAGLGFLNYATTALSSGSWRFTNMSALLISSAVIIFLLGLLSEQLTNLQYKDTQLVRRSRE